MLKRIGITGGIGSGKTTVCKIFESLDIPIYYADIEAKKLMMSNLAVKRQIIDILGSEAYHKNGKLDRAYISNLIFNDQSILSEINRIVHPAVQLDSTRWFETIGKEMKASYAIKEAALLVENGTFKHLDALIVVTCPLDIRIDRVMYRDKISKEKVLERMKNQLDDKAKLAVADYEIVNDGIHSLIPQIVSIHKKLTST